MNALTPTRLLETRAAIHQDDVSEAVAITHQNVASDLAGFVEGLWQSAGVRAHAFACLSDVLGDLDEELDPGHLQALYKVRQAKAVQS